MGLRLDPPAHEAVGQMMDPHGVDTNYILKPHVFLFPCGPSNLDSNTQLLLNLAWGCYSGHWVLSLPFQPHLVYFLPLENQTFLQEKLSPE